MPKPTRKGLKIFLNFGSEKLKTTSFANIFIATAESKSMEVCVMKLYGNKLVSNFIILPNAIASTWMNIAIEIANKTFLLFFIMKVS